MKLILVSFEKFVLKVEQVIHSLQATFSTCIDVNDDDSQLKTNSTVHFKTRILNYIIKNPELNNKETDDVSVCLNNDSP